MNLIFALQVCRCKAKVLSESIREMRAPPSDWDAEGESPEELFADCDYGLLPTRNRRNKLALKECRSSAQGGNPPATTAGFLCPNFGHKSDARAIPRREGG